LLGGAERICGEGDNVLVKVNLAMATPWLLGETTHPTIVAAVVKLLTETGATVRVGERSGWGVSTRKAFERSGVGEAALQAGAKEIICWEEGNKVEVEVPEGRIFNKVTLHESIINSDVFVNLSKLKNNWMLGDGGLTIGLKNLFGMLYQKSRDAVHKQPVEVAWACCDLAKIIHPKHRFTLVDGIYAVEGNVHYGHVCRPGFIVASPDMVAAEAVTYRLVDYHPLESPGVQIMMKTGLGTGDLSEINILGARLQDLIYPFKRFVPRYVQKYMNVREYIGGTCLGCQYAMMSFPPVVDPRKRYAVVAGTRASVPLPLKDVDEVWLIGKCASRKDHSSKEAWENIHTAKNVKKIPTCPGNWGLTTMENLFEGIYSIPMLLASDALAFCGIPEMTRPNILSDAEARREGRQTELPSRKKKRK